MWCEERRVEAVGGSELTSGRFQVAASPVQCPVHAPVHSWLSQRRYHTTTSVSPPSRPLLASHTRHCSPAASSRCARPFTPSVSRLLPAMSAGSNAPLWAALHSLTECVATLEQRLSTLERLVSSAPSLPRALTGTKRRLSVKQGDTDEQHKFPRIILPPPVDLPLKLPSNRTAPMRHLLRSLSLWVFMGDPQRGDESARRQVHSTVTERLRDVVESEDVPWSEVRWDEEEMLGEVYGHRIRWQFGPGFTASKSSRRRPPVRSGWQLSLGAKQGIERFVCVELLRVRATGVGKEMAIRETNSDDQEEEDEDDDEHGEEDWK